MAVDPPYRTDPFQNIINVLWSATNTAWFTGFPAGGRFIVTMRHTTIYTGPSVSTEGSPCLVTDMQTTYLFGDLPDDVRPGMQPCQWPIPTPVDPPTLAYPYTSYPYNSYSAGTLYRKVSDCNLAYANSRSTDDIRWNCRFFSGTGPLAGGPDTSPAEGALCPELNTAGTDWETYSANKLASGQRPIYHPNYQIFVVLDEDYVPSMLGIHDPHDRPDLAEFP